MAVCGMKCIHLRNEAIKILGVYFSDNKKIKDDTNFYNIVSNIQGVLNLWRMRNFLLEGRIVVFKMLTISKIVFLALLTKIPPPQPPHPHPPQVVKELEKIQKYFFCKDSTPKIRLKEPVKTTKTVA